MQDIDTALVQKVLDPIWLTKTETASRVRARIERILDWAARRGLRNGANPARWRGHLEFCFAFFTPKGPTGWFYLMDIRDKAGEALDGANAYRLTVPANAPVRQYWSATVYDRVTHTLIRGQKTVSRSSQSPRACRRTPTDRWTSILVPRLPRPKSRIGCRRAPAETLKSCFVMPRCHDANEARVRQLGAKNGQIVAILSSDRQGSGGDTR